MNTENSPDGFKEADEVADGMIPDSQIVNIINQITLAKDAEVQPDHTVVKRELAKTS